jgi:hypothetical protein
VAAELRGLEAYIRLSPDVDQDMHTDPQTQH